MLTELLPLAVATVSKMFNVERAIIKRKHCSWETDILAVIFWKDSPDDCRRVCIWQQDGYITIWLKEQDSLRVRPSEFQSSLLKMIGGAYAK